MAVLPLAQWKKATSVLQQLIIVRVIALRSAEMASTMEYGVWLPKLTSLVMMEI